MSRRLWMFCVCVLALFPTMAHASTQTMVFGGDIMLGRAVRDRIVAKGKNSGDWTTLNVAAVFRNADFAFANLESPFAPGPALGYSMVFRADPAHVSALTNAGIDVVSFANNHARNQGSQGIRTTLELLGKNAIAAAGAGLTSKSAYAPRYVRAGDQLVAVLAYTYNEQAPQRDIATPTVAAMDTTIMQAEVRKAVQRGAFVIVSMHAGTEYVTTPTSRQKQFARAAIDAGAAMVVGHHPHWVQPVEKHKGRPIIYSLGNLVFDQPWSRETQQGGVAVVTVVNGSVTRVQVRTVKIDYAAQPRWMTASEAKPVLARIGLPSGILNFP